MAQEQFARLAFDVQVCFKLYQPREHHNSVCTLFSQFMNNGLTGRPIYNKILLGQFGDNRGRVCKYAAIKPIHNHVGPRANFRILIHFRSVANIGNNRKSLLKQFIGCFFAHLKLIRSHLRYGLCNLLLGHDCLNRCRCTGKNTDADEQQNKSEISLHDEKT